MTEIIAFSSRAETSKQTKQLIYAVQHNMPRTARQAIGRGGDVHVKDNQGNSLLHICPTAQVGATLIEKGADVNARNNAGQTPLHSSMRRGTINLTKLLIMDHADVNAQENNGGTPLHLAESSEVNKILLDVGANPNVQNSAGDTPLHFAIRLKGVPIISELIARGADKTIRNKAGDDAYSELQKLIHRTETELANISRAVISSPTLSPEVLTSGSTLNTVTSNTSGGLNFPAFDLSRQACATSDTSKQSNATSTFQATRPKV